MHILMVAAENGAIPGGKVGGIGDVIRDIPRALSHLGHRVSVITPGYEVLSKACDAEFCHTLTLKFCGHLEQVALFRKDLTVDGSTVTHWFVENPLFAACGDGKIYCEDSFGPFATDAQKFSLFCLAVCHALVTEAIDDPDVLHLHDWHAALVLFISRYLVPYQPLQDKTTVYSIHNLSIQGIRPLRDNGSSLENWYGFTKFDTRRLADPDNEDCVNLMRMGINLANRVHVVSPHYAEEILKPSRPDKGYVGGERLEKDLQKADRSRRLVGILNGCEYPKVGTARVSARQFIELASKCLEDWSGNSASVRTSWFLAQQRLLNWSLRKKNWSCISASVGRLVWQKVALLVESVNQEQLVLDSMLEADKDSCIILLGSGDPRYEELMTLMMRKHQNFLFLNGYSDELSDMVYRYCDAFLMPSIYEPCGISQMLALRAGKPCLVHAVGGLVNTVHNEKNGFVFDGTTMTTKINALLMTYSRMLSIKKKQPKTWTAMKKAARQSRFEWTDTASEYVEKLYSHD